MTCHCDIDVIHERHDTLFGGRLPSPNESTMRSLINFVLENKSDIGLATDGDADRLGVIDEKGDFVHPNKILVLLYYYLIKYKGWHGPVVRNISTTHMLDKVAQGLGEKCYEVPVGFKNISSKMNETDAVIGGESSGGLTVRGHISGKDGIYAAVLLIEMMCVTGKKLSQLYDEITQNYGNVFSEERDYHFTSAVKNRVVQMAFEDKKLPKLPYEVEKVSYLDGCKIYFTNGGWTLIRMSGTEPLLRLVSEMPSVEMAKNVCNILEAFFDLI